MFDVGDEVKASEYIVDKWLSLKNSDIYKDWALGIASGFIDKPSFLDTSPGIKYLKKRLSEFDGFKRSVSVTAVDINSGEPHTMTDKNTKFDEF